MMMKYVKLNEGLAPSVAVNAFSANTDALLFIRATDIDEGLITLAFSEPGDADDTRDEVLLASEKSLAGCKAAIKSLCEEISMSRSVVVNLAGPSVSISNVNGYPVSAGIDEITTLVLAADGDDVVIPWADSSAAKVGLRYRARIISYTAASEEEETDGYFNEDTFVYTDGVISSAINTTGISFSANDLLGVFDVGDVFAVRVEIFSDSNPTGIVLENTGATEEAGYTFTAS